MECSARAFARLPETYAAALRLQARGLSDQAIAATLGLEPAAIRPLLQLAQAKLDALREVPDAVPDAVPATRPRARSRPRVARDR